MEDLSLADLSASSGCYGSVQARMGLAACVPRLVGVQRRLGPILTVPDTY